MEEYKEGILIWSKDKSDVEEFINTYGFNGLCESVNPDFYEEKDCHIFLRKDGEFLIKNGFDFNQILERNK